MCLTFGDRRQTSTRDLGPLPFRTSPWGCPTGDGAGSLKSNKPAQTGMTTVEAVMVGCGDAYRIERLYLDRDQTYRVGRRRTA